jgi:hypothetical protein
MARFGDDRAPLELTKASSRQKIMGCPFCKTGRYVSINTVGIICGVCNKFFTDLNCLPSDKIESMLNDDCKVTQEYMKYRADMEKKAYAYKDKVLDQKKKGIVRTHEPGDIKRRK